jgi:DNA-binding response OmpR family regulator
VDIHLPGINGTQRIREFDITTPIIALTAISLEMKMRLTTIIWNVMS